MRSRRDGKYKDLINESPVYDENGTSPIILQKWNRWHPTWPIQMVRIAIIDRIMPHEWKNVTTDHWAISKWTSHFCAWLLVVSKKPSAGQWNISLHIIQYIPINPRIARKQLSLVLEMTHPAHSFEMIAVLLEVDELAVESPWERHIQSWITGNLAG